MPSGILALSVYPMKIETKHRDPYFICPLTKAMGKLKMRRNPAHDLKLK